MLEEAPEVDTIIAPIGGGGLLAGIALPAVDQVAPALVQQARAEPNPAVRQ